MTARHMSLSCIGSVPFLPRKLNSDHSMFDTVCASSHAPLMVSCRRQQCSADSPSRWANIEVQGQSVKKLVGTDRWTQRLHDAMSAAALYEKKIPIQKDSIDKWPRRSPKHCNCRYSIRTHKLWLHVSGLYLQHLAHSGAAAPQHIPR